MTKHIQDYALLIISIVIFLNLIFSDLGLLIMYFLIIVLFFIELSRRKKYLKLARNVKVIIIFLMFWVIYSLIQLNFSVDFEKGITDFLILMNGVVLIYFICSIVNSSERLKTLYSIWGISLLIVILLGWFEHITGINIGNTGARFVNVVTVNYYNPNNYSFVLTISIPIVLYWIRDKNFFNKALGIFMYLSSFYFIYVNQTRLSLLLFLFITVIFLASLLRKRKSTFILFSLLIVTGILMNLDNILEIFEQLQTLDSADGSLNKRSLLTGWAIQIPMENPLGVGPGQAEYYMPVIGSNLHNFWLEMLANFGFVIFLGMVLFFLYFFYKVIFEKKTNELKTLISPMFWVVLIFIPASNGPSSIFSFGLLWFIFAMMLSTINIVGRNAYK